MEKCAYCKNKKGKLAVSCELGAVDICKECAIKHQKRLGIKQEAIDELIKLENIKVIDEIGKFWVVTKPTRNSTMADIVFEADVKYMMNQCRGGLDEEDIMSIFKTKEPAEKLGGELLINIRNKNLEKF